MQVWIHVALDCQGTMCYTELVKRHRGMEEQPYSELAVTSIGEIGSPGYLL